MRLAGVERFRLRRRSLLKFALLLWLLTSAIALSVYFRNHNATALWLVPLPVLTAISLYCLVFFHETGHLTIGLLLGFPVTGIEMGTFPFKTIRLKKLTCRIGRLPWWGRTLLGVSAKTFSPLRHFVFVSGGLVFEGIFLLVLYFLVRHIIFLKVVLGLLFLDQIAVNFFPKYEHGHAVNDGALLLEIFSKKSAFAPVLRSLF